MNQVKLRRAVTTVAILLAAVTGCEGRGELTGVRCAATRTGGHATPALWIAAIAWTLRRRRSRRD